MNPCNDPGAPLIEFNYAYDAYSISGAPGSMCRVEKYLGVEIGSASGSASLTVTALLFDENGIIYVTKLCAIESMVYNKNYKLDCLNNARGLISRE